ncbi:hypothetical protein GGS20DRAFT_544914 [Poronia punctata]|nr:hypothetical protein GGS20DRAFT_544914 [Poronia punctata]
MFGSHRENADFARARWRKRVILPCWLVQVGILLSLMGLFSYRLSHTVATWKEAEDKGDVPVVEFVWEVANIAFSLTSLVVTLVAIARYIAEVLTPLPMLFGCILNLVLSVVVMALDIVIYIRRADKKYSIIGLILDIALIIFTIIPLIYAIVIYRRLLSYEDYHLPGNHKPYGFVGIEDPIDDASPPIYRNSNNTPSIYDPTNYDPMKHGLGTITTVTAVEPAKTQTRGRSISIGSRRISLNLSRGPSPSLSGSPEASPSLVEQTTAKPLDRRRRTSYDHKRDTQFEAYLARRTSQTYNNNRDSVDLYDDVKRALGTEFGFGDLPTPADRDTKARSRGSSIHLALTRQTSFEVVVGGGGGGGGSGSLGSPGVTVTVTTPPEEHPAQLGHSLNCVPEAHEEEAADALVKRNRGFSESRQALLNHGDKKKKNNNISGRRRGSPDSFQHVDDGLQDIELENTDTRRTRR